MKHKKDNSKHKKITKNKNNKVNNKKKLKNKNLGKNSDSNVPKVKKDEAENKENTKGINSENKANKLNLNFNIKEKIDIIEKIEAILSKNSNLIKKIYISFGGAVLGLAVIYLGISFIYYGNRFLPKTVVNGVDRSSVTVKDMSEDIEKTADNYSLEISNKNGVLDVVKGSDISLKSEDTLNNVEALCDSQSKIKWIKYLFADKGEDLKLDYKITYDENKLKNSINNSKSYNLQKTNDGKNAYLELSGDKIKIMPAQYSDEVDKGKYIECFKNKLKTLNGKLSLDDDKCYVKPVVNEDLPSVKEACEKANKILSKNIKMIAFDREHPVNKEAVAAWLDVDDKGEFTIDDTDVKKFMNSLAGMYNTYNKDRQFKTGWGNTVTVKGGDYGREIDADKLCANIYDVIEYESQRTFEVPFTKTCMGSVTNDIGTTYVEVDLTKQHLFMFVNGQKVEDADIVTGRADGVHDTPQGTYVLKNKMLNATLVGPGYATPVDYWMPFNGGIGLHDATWQPRFGGNRYVYGGSHGCVNLPLDVAKNIFKHAVVGMPVVCYYNE